MALKVHHLRVSQSERVVWLCEELGIEYELQIYERAPIMAPSDYKTLHPLGAAPVIQAGEITLAESGACVEYICQTYGGGKLVVTPGQKNYAEYLYWFHFANGTLHSLLMRNVGYRWVGLGEDNVTVQRYDQKQKEILEFIDRRLSEVPYLAGDEFTAADIMNVVCLTGVRRYFPYSLSGYDNILAYLKRIGSREAYRRALEKADSQQDVDMLIGAAPPPLHPGLLAMMKAAGKS